MMIQFRVLSYSLGLLVFLTGCAFSKPVEEPSPLRSVASQGIGPINRETIIVVHAQSRFDENLQAKFAIDKIISSARSSRKSIVFLADIDGSEKRPALPLDWYTDWKAPDILYISRGGEHRLPLANPEITVIGGFFGTYDLHRGCHTFALRNVVNSYFNLQKQRGPLTIHLPLSATYFWPADQSLRAEIIAGADPRLWLDKMIELIFTSDDGPLELGRAEYKLPRNNASRVQNPFSFPGNQPAKNIKPLKISAKVSATIDAREPYQQDPPIDISTYKFRIYSSGIFQREIGSGNREVNLMFSP